MDIYTIGAVVMLAVVCTGLTLCMKTKVTKGFAIAVSLLCIVTVVNCVLQQRASAQDDLATRICVATVQADNANWAQSSLPAMRSAAEAAVPSAIEDEGDRATITEDCYQQLKADADAQFAPEEAEA